jgi:hypothetical protein
MSKYCIAAVVAILAAHSAMADETLKFRTILHATAVQTQNVGDIEGHTMSLGRFEGLATFPGGTVGTAYFTTVTDYVHGSGEIMRVYYNITFDDGSVIWMKNTATQQQPK